MKFLVGGLLLLTATLCANPLDSQHELFIPRHDPGLAFKQDIVLPDFGEPDHRHAWDWTEGQHRGPRTPVDPPSATPEPATLWLTGLVLIALFVAPKPPNLARPERHCEAEGCPEPPIRGGDFCGPHQLLFTDTRIPEEEPFRTQALDEQAAELEVLYLKDSPEEALADALIRDMTGPRRRS